MQIVVDISFYKRHVIEYGPVYLPIARRAPSGPRGAALPGPRASDLWLCGLAAVPTSWSRGTATRPTNELQRPLLSTLLSLRHCLLPLYHCKDTLAPHYI